MYSKGCAALAIAAALSVCSIGDGATAQSTETSNGCMGTTDDPCIRIGDCAIQGATWSQTVTIARSDLYDTMGWAGVCDQVHVALVQGNCSPGGAQIDVTADLANASSAFIPAITGPLSCNALPPLAVPAASQGATIGLAALLSICGVLSLVSRRCRTAV